MPPDVVLGPMAHLCFTPNLQRHLRCEEQEHPGSTVAEILEGAFTLDPRLRGYVLEDDGSLRKHMNIFLNGEQINDRQTLGDAVVASDELYIMQALSGG